jgi:hypothetical protein
MVACLAFAEGTMPAEATAQAVGINGRYESVPTASDDIRAAIEATVRGMNFIKRPIARSRLRGTNPVAGFAVLRVEQGRVKISFDGGPVMDSPENGIVVKWRREDGKVFDLSSRWEGYTLVQTIGADEGTRIDRFTLSDADMTLTQQVTVSSPQLPRALQYKLVYRRAPAE